MPTFFSTAATAASPPRASGESDLAFSASAAFSASLAFLAWRFFQTFKPILAATLRAITPAMAGHDMLAKGDML